MYEHLFKRPFVMSFLGDKGGSGKTTISTNIAHGFSLRNFKVLIADADPQASARDWSCANSASIVPVIGLDRETLDVDLKSVSNGYQLIIIDGPGKFSKVAAKAIKVSDVVFIPVQPSPYDVWSVVDLVEKIKERRVIADGTPDAAFIISRAIKNTVLGNDVSKALGDYGLTILNGKTHQAEKYKISAVKGESVFSSGENQQAHEMNSIIEEIIARYIGRAK